MPCDEVDVPSKFCSTPCLFILATFFYGTRWLGDANGMKKGEEAHQQGASSRKKCARMELFCNSHFVDQVFCTCKLVYNK